MFLCRLQPKELLMSKLPLGLLAASAFGVLAAAASAAQLSRQDQTFVEQATTGNLAEIQAGQMALTKGSSPEVKQLAQAMVADHSSAADQLSQIAQQNGLNLPTQPTAAQRADAQHLSTLNGPQFDEAFARHEVEDHQKVIAQFQAEVKSGRDPALKSFAQQTLPALQKHLRLAQAASRG
jgi:putative membrane protein